MKFFYKNFNLFQYLSTGKLNKSLFVKLVDADFFNIYTKVQNYIDE